MFFSAGFGHYEQQLPFGQFFLTLVLISIVITWFQNNCGGSLVPAFICHALINLSGEILPLIERAEEGQGDYRAWILANGLFAIIVAVVLAIWGSGTLTRRKR